MNIQAALGALLFEDPRLNSEAHCTPWGVPQNERCDYVSTHLDVCGEGTGLVPYMRLHYCTFSFRCALTLGSHRGRAQSMQCCFEYGAEAPHTTFTCPSHIHETNSARDTHLQYAQILAKFWIAFDSVTERTSHSSRPPISLSSYSDVGLHMQSPAKPPADVFVDICVVSGTDGGHRALFLPRT